MGGPGRRDGERPSMGDTMGEPALPDTLSGAPRTRTNAHWAPGDMGAKGGAYASEHQGSLRLRDSRDRRRYEVGARLLFRRSAMDGSASRRDHRPLAVTPPGPRPSHVRHECGRDLRGVPYRPDEGPGGEQPGRA